MPALLDQHRIERLRHGFVLVLPVLESVVDRMYANLFAASPDVAALFLTDLGHQRSHFAGALTFLVRNLDRLEIIRPALAGMGARHAGYGVCRHHFDAFADALVDALCEALGPEAYPEFEEDWRAFMDAVADLMQFSEARDAA